MNIEHMKEFSQLHPEKRSSIANAAMSVFAAAGYKKAYISEIAAAAGISKALVFYYFGTKKALYLYLIDYAYNIIMANLQEGGVNKNDDFFDRIREITRIKLFALKRNPAVMNFLNSVYFETDKEIAGDLETLNSKGGLARENLALDGINFSKFKDGVDPKLIVNILVKYTEGVVNSRTDSALTFDESMDDFNKCLDLLKNNLYKGDYL